VKEAESISEYSQLVQVFSRLPETYRAALEMKFLLDYSGKEIAQRLGISEAAVHTRISRGRALLKELLEQEGFHI
jgi:RNA polymerase sigma-70 factor (ECF subfamily)